MDTFVIDGGRRLSGTIAINGSKNAALPLMAAALLTPEPVVLRDVPHLADIRNMQRLLERLGCRVQRDEADHLSIQATTDAPAHAPYEIVKTMRAGICVLGPLLARRGEARVSMPGGCAIGDRPVDLHLRGLAALGADATLDGGDILVRAPRTRHGPRLRGARVFLGGPMGSTVLGTANVMSAAALAQGETMIECAACEPEIVDLANLLNSMGARITGAGSPRILIEGVTELNGATHRVIPDRIEAGTFAAAAAITGGDLVLENCPLDALMAFTDRLHAMGVRVTALEGADPMRAAARFTAGGGGTLRPIEVTTQPHPGFPTDLQAQLMALLTLADGNSVITEKIFPERFLHVPEMSRMGAHLFRVGPTVVVSGVRRLVGAPVMASDLRASAGLVLAGLAAEGTTTVNRVYHIDRGYEALEDRLRSLGASIRRVDDREGEPVLPVVVTAERAVA